MILVHVHQEGKLCLLTCTYILGTFSGSPASHFRCMGKFLRKMSQVTPALSLSSAQSHTVSRQPVVEQFLPHHGDQMQGLVIELNKKTLVCPCWSKASVLLL